MDLGPDDVGYVCMPLFHSNAVQVGWAPSLVTPCAVGLGPAVLGLALAARRPPLRRDVLQLHRQTARVPARATRSSPTTPTTRCGSRSATRVRPRSSRAFGRRFGLEVIDAYGATEGGVAVNRDADRRPGALGHAPDHVQIVDDEGDEKARAVARRARPRRSTPRSASARSSTRRVRARSRATTTTRTRPAKTTRFGWYWSGDLGYKDADGYLYFAGRNADWIRVDGENFPAGPIEETLRHAPGVVLAAVYGVPDDQAGDQVMAGLVLADDASRSIPSRSRRGSTRRTAIGPKWRPRYLRDPARSAHHRHEQDRETHARAREVPPRPRRR